MYSLHANTHTHQWWWHHSCVETCDGDLKPWNVLLFRFGTISRDVTVKPSLACHKSLPTSVVCRHCVGSTGRLPYPLHITHTLAWLVFKWNCCCLCIVCHLISSTGLSVCESLGHERNDWKIWTIYWQRKGQKLNSGSPEMSDRNNSLVFQSRILWNIH